MKPAASNLFLMASLEQRDTGLPFVVWISQCGDFGHDVRIWLSRSPKAAPSEMVVVSIRPNVRVVEGSVSPANFALLSRWVELNRDVLVGYWNGDITSKDDAINALVSMPLSEAQATLVVHGINGTSATLSTADLDNLRQQNVRINDHGTPATFQGALLTDVLAKVDLPTGEKFQGTAASYYLLVEAMDGYRAVFSWTELDSTFMAKSVFVATERDGKPLSDKDGPFELVVPGESRDSRWVRQVAALRLRQGN
jgi:hypothetical protein